MLRVKLILLTGLFLLNACSTKKTNSNQLDSLNVEDAENKDVTFEVYNGATKLTNHPGKVVLLKFAYFGPYKKEKLKCDGVELSYMASKNLAKVYLGESYFSTRKNYKCYFEYINELGEEKSLHVAEVEITPFKYPFDRLNVDQKRVILSKKDRKRVEKEKKMLNELYQKRMLTPFFDTAFVKPLDSYVTSIYGTRRLFNNKKATQHLGVDFRAQVGTPVPSANNGKVLYVGDLFYSGLTVLVDHGLGIITYYAHLSKITATKGEYIPKGTILGLSGMSGRVNGPHLHWGVNLNGEFVDGNSLADAGI